MMYLMVEKRRRRPPECCEGEELEIYEFSSDVGGPTL